LALPSGVAGLRPTGARVRGAIYDRIGPEIVGVRVLDLFAGSGALSIEALSRGASHATLVEVDARVVRFLQRQLGDLGLTASTTVVRDQAASFLSRPRGSDPAYDLVLVDPPFATPEVFAPLAQALVQGWLAPDALVVCERERVRGTSPSVAWPSRLRLELSRNYGQAVVEFLRHVPSTLANSADSEGSEI
jgi:16S rRNA (guanine966-N2)-methyltransferase